MASKCCPNCNCACNAAAETPPTPTFGSASGQMSARSSGQRSARSSGQRSAGSSGQMSVASNRQASARSSGQMSVASNRQASAGSSGTQVRSSEASSEAEGSLSTQDQIVKACETLDASVAQKAVQLKALKTRIAGVERAFSDANVFESLPFRPMKQTPVTITRPFTRPVRMQSPSKAPTPRSVRGPPTPRSVRGAPTPRSVRGAPTASSFGDATTPSSFGTAFSSLPSYPYYSAESSITGPTDVVLAMQNMLAVAEARVRRCEQEMNNLAPAFVGLVPQPGQG